MCSPRYAELSRIRRIVLAAGESGAGAPDPLMARARAAR